MGIDPEYLEAWMRHRADWPRGQPRELRALLRRIPLDANLPTDDGELRFERLDVYAEGALLHFYYLRRREDGTPRNPSMWLGDTVGGGAGLWFRLADPEDDDYPDAGPSPEPPTAWPTLDDFPPTPEPTVVITDDPGNRYEGLPVRAGERQGAPLHAPRRAAPRPRGDRVARGSRRSDLDPLPRRAAGRDQHDGHRSGTARSLEDRHQALRQLRALCPTCFPLAFISSNIGVLRWGRCGIR